jgi:periplasmic copper chaperone A
MRFFPILCAVPMFAALAGCGHHDDAISADHGWVRLAAVAGRPAAAYLVVHGGPEAAQLIAVESPQAGSSELHQSMKMSGGGMMAMQRLEALNVPAHGDAAFAPGGNHVMLFGVSPQIKAGDKMPLTLRFAKGPPITIDAKVVGAGDAAPY